MAKILVVDDEDNILHSLERTFIMTDHQLDTAISGAAALAMLREEKYDVVISDMRMPVMNGQQFLAQARRLYPEAIRFILSGYADRDIVLEAARLGDAKAFLLKPWQNDDIVRTVEQALEMRARCQHDGLMSLVVSYHDIPVAKMAQDHLLMLLEEDKTTSIITDAVARHTSVVAALLRISWVAFPGNRPTGLYHALSLLGWENATHIIRNLPLRQEVAADAVQGKVIESLNLHSHRVQRELVRLLQVLNLNRQEIDCDYLGLVHDIGLLCLLEYQPKQWAQIRANVEAQGISQQEAELAVLEYDHAMLGAALLEWWGIPGFVCQAVRWHHCPLMAAPEGRKLAGLLHVADYLAQIALTGVTAGVIDGAVLAMLGIDDGIWKTLQEGSIDA